MNYIQGDLIQLFKQGKFDLIGHQCNCFRLGAGIAKSLIKEFPQVQVERHGNDTYLFGTHTTVDTDFGSIINIYSQYTAGCCTYEGIDSFEVRLGALKNCLSNLNKNNKGKTIGLPLIASGLAADQTRKGAMSDLEYFQKFIESTIEESLPDMDVKIIYI